MKKIFKTLILVLTAFVLASCSNNPGQVNVISAPAGTPVKASPPAATVQPSPEDAQQQLAEEDIPAVASASTPVKASPTATVQPSSTDTPQFSSAEISQLLAEGNIPAYLTAGLQKRSEMQPEWEWFYYISYHVKASLGFYSDLVEVTSGPGHFNETTSADLNGDGKEETITLIGGEPYDGVADTDPSYSDITIDIDGNRIKLTNEDGLPCPLPFTLHGKIIDIDKSDGKKEILYEASIMIGPTTDYIVTYDDNKPRKVFAGELFYPDYTIGAGYIMTQGYYNTAQPYASIYYYELWKMKSDRSGFEPAGNKYYPALHQEFCWDENGKWDESNAAPTQSDEYLYKEPGGSEKVLIKKGTPVFIGLYAKKSWLMILNAKGELLGWLDADKVDFNEYTNHAFEPEGD